MLNIVSRCFFVAIFVTIMIAGQVSMAMYALDDPFIQALL